MAAAAGFGQPLIIISSSSPTSAPTGNSENVSFTAQSSTSRYSKPAISPPVSPPLFAPKEKIQYPKQPFKLGSRAAPIPEGVVTGFRTASAFVDEFGIGDKDIHEDKTDKQCSAEKRTPSSKRRKLSSKEEKSETKAKRRRKPKANPCNELTEDKNLIELSSEEVSPQQDADVPTVLETDEARLQGRIYKQDGDHQNETAVPNSKKKKKRRSDSSKLKLDKKPKTKQTSVAEAGKIVKPNVERARKRSAFKLPPGISFTDEVSKYFPEKANTLKECSPTAALLTFEDVQRKEADQPEDPALASNMEMFQCSMEDKDPATSDFMMVLDGRSPHESDMSKQAEFNQLNLASPNRGLGDKPMMSNHDIAKSKEPTLTKTTIFGESSAKTANAKVGATAKKTKTKKARTITALAIAKAQVVPTSKTAAVELSFGEKSDGLDTESFTFGNISKPHINPNLNKPRTGADEQDGKKKKRTSKTKMSAAALMQSKIRSPSSANRRMEKQTFLFGTSSQIVREDDADVILDLQRALKVSEEESCLQLVDSEAKRKSDFPNASRKLWLAGTEVDDNDIVLALKDANSTKVPPVMVDLPEDRESMSYKTSQAPTIENVETVTLTDSPGMANAASNARHKPLGSISAASKLKLTSAPLSGPKLLFQPPKRMESSINSGLAISQIMAAHVAQQAAPISTKAGSKAGKEPQEKPKSKRKKDETADAAAQTVDAARPSAKRPRGRPKKDPTAAPNTPRRKKRASKPAADQKTAHPNEEEQAGAATLEEIEDNEPPTPSPPHRHSPSSIAKLDLTPLPFAGVETIDLANHDERAKIQATEAAAAQAREAAAAETAAPNATAAKAATEARAKARAETKARAEAAARRRLFPLITRAVKRSARGEGTDTQGRSWWERILMYEPVALEELGAWLRDSGGLSADAASARGAAEEEEVMGEDKAYASFFEAGAVKALVLRRWCDENGICCVYREREWNGG